MVRFLIALGLAALPVAGGCGVPADAGAGPWMDLPAEPAAEVSDAELFFHLVPQAEPITQNQAYHAFLVWMDGKDESGQFGQRVAALQERGILDARWVHHPLKPLTRGRLASMVCRKLKLRSSLALAVFGPIERAARRELVYRAIMPAGGGDADPLSGAEFVNVLKRADEHELREDVAPRPEQPVE